MLKLNLGSGETYLDGYINIDNSKNVYADMKFDLFKFPYPFKSNSVSECVIIHFLEHIPDQFGFFKELYRICENNAKISIEVPFSTSGFCCIQHNHYYNWDTFRNLGDNHSTDYLPFRFRLVEQSVKNKRWRKKIPRFICKPLSYFFPAFVDNIWVELRVIKDSHTYAKVNK